MSITSAIVLFAVIWFMVLFVVLPLRLRTQADEGEVVPGTQSSAPASIDMKKKFRVTTIVSAVIWVIVFTVILSGVLTVENIDMFGTMDRD